MPLPLFHKIIDEAATIPQITMVAFAGLAEPLMDPLLIPRITYTKKKRQDWRTEMYTNGVRLTPERFEQLKAAGLDVIVISLNAASAEQHERLMGLKGKYDLVCSHADYAIAHSDSMYIDVRAVATVGEFTLDDARTFVKRWGVIQLGGHGKLVQELNWAGGNRTVSEFDPNSCCQRALEQIAVHRDGRVLLCCYDPLGKYPFGDLKTQTIREVYNSAPYVEFREWHRDNQAAKHPLCKICTRV
jgi:radical SAM protein with 4Fe4S-binding SPASM domain